MNTLLVRSLLVVDDEPALIDSLTETLGTLGVALWTAKDGEEALEIVSNNSVTAILSDIQMPGYSGLELLESLRAQGNDIPFVFLTGSMERAFLHRALQLGAVDFLEKPVDSQRLIDVVYKVLEIGTKQNQLNKLKVESQKTPTPLVLKQKYINILRIKLPWRKGS